MSRRVLDVLGGNLPLGIPLDERFTSRGTAPLILEALVAGEHGRVKLFTTVYSTRAERSRSHKNVFPISSSLFHVNRANSGTGTGPGVLYKFWEHGFGSSAKTTGGVQTEFVIISEALWRVLLFASNFSRVM